MRQAFNYAFDYEAFLNGPLSGFGAFNPHYVPQGIFGYDPSGPGLFASRTSPRRSSSSATPAIWDEGFTVSLITEEANLFAAAGLVLKDSLDKLEPEIPRERAGGRRSGVRRGACAEPDPRMRCGSKNADPAADPHSYFYAYQHPDGDWGKVHGFANGYKDPAKVAELIDQGAVELDTDEAGRDLCGAAAAALRRSDVDHRRPGRRRHGASRLGARVS